MPAIHQDETIYANNSHILEFTITDKDVNPAGPLNVTSINVRWALSRLNSDGTYSKTPVITKSSLVSGEIEKVDPANGVVDVILTEDDTEKLSGKYHQELEIVDGSNASAVVATGTITVLRNIINPS